jgi:hypothetical protein
MALVLTAQLAAEVNKKKRRAIECKKELNSHLIVTFYAERNQNDPEGGLTPGSR